MKAKSNLKKARNGVVVKPLTKIGKSIKKTITGTEKAVAPYKAAKKKLIPESVYKKVKKSKIYREGGMSPAMYTNTTQGELMQRPEPYTPSKEVKPPKLPAELEPLPKPRMSPALEEMMKKRQTPPSMRKEKVYRLGGNILATRIGNSGKPAKFKPGVKPMTKEQKELYDSKALSPKDIKNLKKKKMMTGGMVNSNTKVQADKTPGSKGVKSGVNPKASKQTTARGRVGGTSAAPKTAVPKAMYGRMMKKGGSMKRK